VMHLGFSREAVTYWICSLQARIARQMAHVGYANQKSRGWVALLKLRRMFRSELALHHLLTILLIVLREAVIIFFILDTRVSYIDSILSFNLVP
jgi:hypothetical protein